MDINTVFAFYRNEFLPVYSDLVGYIGDKPRQVLFELEHVFSHLSQTCNPKIGSDMKNDNFVKAYGHLQRATLDCYKLLWIKFLDDLEVMKNNEPLRKFGLKISGSAFLIGFQEFKDLARVARRKEMMCMGLEPNASLEAYKKVIEVGNELVHCRDKNKEKEVEEYIKSLKRTISIKSFILRSTVGFLIGFLSGLFSGYALQYFSF